MVSIGKICWWNSISRPHVFMNFFLFSFFLVFVFVFVFVLLFTQDCCCFARWTAAFIHHVAHAFLNIPVNIRDVCVFTAPLFSGLTSIVTFLFTRVLSLYFFKLVVFFGFLFFCFHPCTILSVCVPISSPSYYVTINIKRVCHQHICSLS